MRVMVQDDSFFGSSFSKCCVVGTGWGEGKRAGMPKRTCEVWCVAEGAYVPRIGIGAIPVLPRKGGGDFRLAVEVPPVLAESCLDAPGVTPLRSFAFPSSSSFL